MAIQRRAAAQAAPSGVSFGDLGFYAGGFSLPEGDYALEFDVRMHANTKQDGTTGQQFLGVMMHCHPLTGGEAHEKFLSMGGKSDQSFAPDPTTGKGLVAIPGGLGQNLSNKTNWALFLKSLYDCGLPQGIFTNDLTVLDGVHVHISNIPEPEERKSFASKTGEVEDSKPRGVNLIPIVTEIKEDGKPWEGSGGIPSAQPVKRGAASKAVAPKRAVAPPPPQETEGDGEEVMTAAINGITEVLEKNPNGTSKLMVRTGTFKAVSAAAGAEMAQAVSDQFFGSDEALNSLLGQLGYVVAGMQVKPQA